MGSRKVFLLLLSLFLLLIMPNTSGANRNQAEQLRVAFVRAGDLWIKAGEKETQVTKTGGISSPKWSTDGRWIAYRKASSFTDTSVPVSRNRNMRSVSPVSSEELWVYQVDGNRHYRISFQGENVKWSPTQTILAFQDESILNIADLRSGSPRSFQNVALGVNNYSWLPNGAGFLASASAKLLPDGWTSPLLYQISINATLDNKLVRRFFNIPHELERGQVKILSIGTSTFAWSQDRDWIAFIVHPTASWSADSNMLCVLSANGRIFKPLADMLAYPQWVQWAPTGNVLAYIEGGGRLATENKRLTIKRVDGPTSQRLTPRGFADGDFTWHKPSLITVSRAAESNWSVEPDKRPKPSLYQIDVDQLQNQKKLTDPPADSGDYSPLYVKHAKQLTWVRAGKTEASIWVANPDGTDAREYVKNIGLGKEYYQMRDWSGVLDWCYR